MISESVRNVQMVYYNNATVQGLTIKYTAHTF